MRFELIHTAPRPIPRPANCLTIGFRIAFSLRPDDFTAIVTRQEQRFLAQWPLVNTIGAGGGRLREFFDGLVTAAAMCSWAETRRWPVPRADLEYLRAQQARARRRFLRALRRVTRRQGSAPSTLAPSPPLDSAVPAVCPDDAAEADNPALVLNLPAYAERPADRWLELYELLNRLPPTERVSRGLFVRYGGQSLWGWACSQRGLFPIPGRHPWGTFSTAMSAGTMARLVPAWAGMVGCAPVDARTLEMALGRIGMAAAIDELDTAWHEALRKGATTVPFTPFSWVPAQGSWYALMDELDRIQPAPERRPAGGEGSAVDAQRMSGI